MLFVVQLEKHGIKVSVANRVLAKAVDFALIVAFAVVLPYPLGPLVGFAYSLLADGMNFGPVQGQSVGKKLFKLQTINAKTKEPVNYKQSALRNSPVGVATFFAIIPIWGWIILALIGIPLMIMEVYLMVTVDSGSRLGDVMGNTEVIEVKVDVDGDKAS